MELERLDTKAFMRTKPAVFEDSFGLGEVFEALAFRQNLILSGAKGIGKSLSLLHFAATKGVPLITFDCSEDVRRSHLIGSFILRGNETPFVLGPIPTAFEIAREHGSAILLLEEINSLSPQAQKILNPVADFRRRVEVPEARKVFDLNGDKLWVVGTMNSACYGGVYELNEDLKSRFAILPLNYPTEEHERAILEGHLGAAAGKYATLIESALLLAKETRQRTFQYALSPRDLVQFLGAVGDLGLEQALWILSGKFEDADRLQYFERAKSIFDVTVKR